MKNYLLLILLFTIFKNSEAQNKKTEDYRYVKLDKNLRNIDNSFEFSSLAKWVTSDGKTKILMIPALKKNHTAPTGNVIYAVDSSEIVNAISPNSKHKIKISDTIQILGESFSNLIDTPGYDGIEATCVIGNTIYFAIETDSFLYPCYIAKGHFDIIKNSTKYKIEIDTIIAIRKDTQIKKNNIGFESLAFYKQKLWVIFEYNNDSNRTLCYKIDNNLRKIDTQWLERLPTRRLSEITVTPEGDLIGVNTFITTTEYYIVKLATDSFIKTHIISMGKTEPNWEGLVVFEDGYLLINDNKEGAKKEHTQLLYIKIK